MRDAPREPLRDLNRWKDKVEVSLDGRQLFFLFFGSAVVACGLFVLGVLVGKRIEARALAMSPPPIEDPLAALDQLGDATDVEENLTYQQSLAEGSPARTGQAAATEKAPAVAEPSPAAPATAVATTAPTTAVPKPSPAAPGVTAAEPPAAAEPAPSAPSANPKTTPTAPTPPALRPGATTATGLASKETATSASAAAAKQPEPGAAPKVVTVSAAAAEPAAKALPTLAGKKPEPPAPAGRFTLQLSAFPERGDAEDFIKKLQAQGYKPFMVASEIPGKGMFYRVRLGDFPSREAALGAKTEFEKKHRMIAYVARL